MLPDTYVIFITENDIFGRGAAFYNIERTNSVTGEPFNDGEHIMYVNGAYNGDSDIGRLMHDFRCADPDEMYNEMLAEKTRYLKENTKGLNRMCKIIEEVKIETIKEIARNMLNDGMDNNAIARLTGLTFEEIQKISEEKDLVPV